MMPEMAAKLYISVSKNDIDDERIYFEVREDGCHCIVLFFG